MGWGKGLAYLWCVLRNAFFVLVVVHVFSRLEVRFEIISIAVLGLIFCAVRGDALVQQSSTLNLAWGLFMDLDRIKRAVGTDDLSSEDREDPQQLKGLLHTGHRMAVIESLFLSLIGLICLLKLFSVL